MWQRTLTIGSTEKTFSSTGLKIGWTIGPEKLVRLCQIVHQVMIEESISNHILYFRIVFIYAQLSRKK